MVGQMVTLIVTSAPRVGADKRRSCVDRDAPVDRDASGPACWGQTGTSEGKPSDRFLESSEYE